MEDWAQGLIASSGQVLLKETPELATQRKEALEREEKLSGERDTARLDLLAQLATARGQDLLQEPEGSQGGLLSSLQATQSKAKEIALALEESRRSFEDVTRCSRSLCISAFDIEILF